MISQIFSLSLNKLLMLSDQVQKFSIEMNDTKTYHRYDKQTVFLKMCVKYLLF